MYRGTFFNFTRMLCNGGSLRDTHSVTVEKQLAMFLHIIGYNLKARMFNLHFIQFGKAITRYFTAVLSAILRLRPFLMKQLGGDTTEEIRNRTTWFPYFQVYYNMNLNHFIHLQL